MAQRARQAERNKQKQRQTRAERRSTERVEAKQQRPTQKPGRPRSQVIGAAITALIVLVVVVYAVIRAHGAATPTHTSSGVPLTNATGATSTGNMLSVGTRAPGFLLKDANGKPYSLALQQGHPVVLEFFAVWCPHCQRMAPVMQRVANTYSLKGVRTWMVLASQYGPNYDTSFGQDTTLATKADLTWFTNSFHENLPKLVDPNFHTVSQYQLNSYPAIYVINKNGVVSYASSGEVPYSQLSKAVTKALASK